ncbi:hypothetical protein P170DRAFT_440275 [Aspergillus steynii IBT 23096]|uniref:Uncharacterized protein n=1 Tax=Aspergillus steynii IBT 23096 TaxID=1392250 RepID=A0A2I2FWZ8_9EURO|nr:uncharacterized protein P170DRAFT_440275 [Aspergillus steynii IBT 23096]PLB45137.1 hypothetical protein P170DRAFT_440275 [Aspergillus steynii IBT 23096]
MNVIRFYQRRSPSFYGALSSRMLGIPRHGHQFHASHKRGPFTQNIPPTSPGRPRFTRFTKVAFLLGLIGAGSIAYTKSQKPPPGGSSGAVPPPANKTNVPSSPPPVQLVDPRAKERISIHRSLRQARSAKEKAPLVPPNDSIKPGNTEPKEKPVQ